MDKAACHCGEIEIRIESEPAKTCFCYCTECQKLSGSDKGFVAHFPENSVTLIKGQPRQYSRKGGSGQDVTYSFCSSCGSMVFGKTAALPLVSVPVPCLENSNNYQPKMAIYTSSAPGWAMFNNDIPNFEKGPA